jgi:hypothetical protein
MKGILISILTLLLLVAAFSCHSPTAPKQNNPPDTTSHNYTWNGYTFGGEYGSSYFKDVAIISDTDIWAVGEIYTFPDTAYNAVHWDGNNWNEVRVLFYYQGKAYYSSIYSIYAFNSKDIWFEAGIHWDGKEFQTVPLNIDFPSHVNKIWGNSSNNLYIVGDSGLIAHRGNDNNWQRMESGTTIDLRDIWGSSDGKTVWACGYSNDFGSSILLKYDGESWKTVWLRIGNSNVSPYGYFVTSVWGLNSLVLSSGRGIFEDTTQVTTLPWFPYQIRGSAENNIAVVGDEGMIWHYNGASWKEVFSHTNQPFYSLDISETIIVAVGVEASIGFGAGVIYLGNHK